MNPVSSKPDSDHIRVHFMVRPLIGELGTAICGRRIKVRGMWSEGAIEPFRTAHKDSMCARCLAVSHAAH